jgi:hypothetical protein
MVASGNHSGGNSRFAGILPLDAHLDLVARTGFDLVRSDPRARVRDEAEFHAMKSHIADLYSGLEPVHSFEDIGGTVFDCIPVEQQPSLREHTGPMPEPPDLTAVLHGGEPQRRPARPQAIPETVEHDRHGNAAWAPTGTIPFPRVTLNDICRFESLDAFFHKHAGVTAPAPGVLEASTPAAGVAEHRYARTDQQAANIGGHSAFTLCSPAVNAEQIFSLSQHWYYGGVGKELQTVEVGWQVFPGMYTHAMPVLFIYWTADHYGGTGNYNLTNKGFVATKGGKAVVGAALSPVSVQGGQQMELDITVYLFEGNWWIYLGGVEPGNALGYYPTSLFAGGQMATAATAIQFGGETCTETESWPAMGSGAFAEEAWDSAAYHRAAYFFPPNGGSQWAEELTPVETPGCYNLGPQPWAERKLAPVPWGSYFYYGGPGGQSC